MAKAEDLPETLALAFEHIRALHAILAALMIDSAALRRVVVTDSRTSRRYRQILAAEAEKTKPLLATALQAYEDEIRRIRRNIRWEN